MNHFQFVDRYIKALKHVANKPSRRHFLGASAASLGLAGLSGSAWLPSVASQMIIFLNGGYDGNDTLLFRDAGFRDYQNTRSGLALSRDSVIALAKGTQGQQLGMNPALEPLLSIYNEGRLAWLANVGALVQPVSAAQVKARSVPLPPFLMSHSEQVDLVQGPT